MKQRVTGVAFLLAFALTSLAFAKGPPVPDGCIFERGVMTCVTFSEPYPTEIRLEVGDTFCYPDAKEFRITLGYANLKLAQDMTTTKYRGVS